MTSKMFTKMFLFEKLKLLQIMNHLSKPVRDWEHLVQRLLFPLFTILLLSSCAGVSVRRDTVRPIAQTVNSKTTEGFWNGVGDTFQAVWEGWWWTFKPRGIRYYQPATFIIVRVNADGSIITDHKILPDTSKKLSAQPVSFLGSGENTLHFKNGMLISSDTQQEADEIPKAIISTAEKLATKIVESGAVGAAMFRVGEEPKSEESFKPVPAFYMFRLAPGPTGYELQGKNGFRFYLPNTN